MPARFIPGLQAFPLIRWTSIPTRSKAKKSSAIAVVFDSIPGLLCGSPSGFPEYGTLKAFPACKLKVVGTPRRSLPSVRFLDFKESGFDDMVRLVNNADRNGESLAVGFGIEPGEYSLLHRYARRRRHARKAHIDCDALRIGHLLQCASSGRRSVITISCLRFRRLSSKKRSG